MKRIPKHLTVPISETNQIRSEPPRRVWSSHEPQSQQSWKQKIRKNSTSKEKQETSFELQDRRKQPTLYSRRGNRRGAIETGPGIASRRWSAYHSKQPVNLAHAPRHSCRISSSLFLSSVAVCHIILCKYLYCCTLALPTSASVDNDTEYYFTCLLAIMHRYAAVLHTINEVHVYGYYVIDSNPLILHTYVRVCIIASSTLVSLTHLRQQATL